MNDAVEGPVALSLVICTFHREKLLRKALDSVAVQRAPAGFALEIVVVDNSDDSSARDVVQEFAANSRFPTRLVEAHPPNISIARNAGVGACVGQAIAFLDDDQEIAEGWLVEVAEALRDHGVGQFLDDLLLLRVIENVLDQMDFDQRHGIAPGWLSFACANTRA